jgi:hypothetical protein
MATWGGGGASTWKGNRFINYHSQRKKCRCLNGGKFLNKIFKFDRSLSLYALSDELYSLLNSEHGSTLKKEDVYFHTGTHFGFFPMSRMISMHIHCDFLQE